MLTPDFLIVGAMKAATFTLSRNLTAHPAIFVPHGELHYFSDPATFAKGAAHYAAHFADAKSHQIIGEKSVPYYFTPEVPARIHALNPHTKLIWLLRDPVPRAVSHYWFFVSRGTEDRSLQAAIRQEQAGEDVRLHARYLYLGQYADHITAYDAFFPREQMLFLRFEDFVENPSAGLDHVARFVGADMTTFRFPNEIHRENTTRMPLSQPLQVWARRVFRDRAFRVWKTIREINTALGPAKYPPLDPKSRAALYTYFEPYNQRLSDLIGWDMSGWRGTK